MSALLVDTESLDFVRELIVSGRYDPALAALDIMTARAPKTDEPTAIGPQTKLLWLLTGRDWRDSLLTMAEAKRMISELLDTGETTHGGHTIITCSRGDKMRSTHQRKSSIPF
jgi:hypothetical protein